MHQDAPPPPPAGRPTIEFRSAYDQGFARVAAVTLPVALADPAANAAAIIEQARSLSDDGVCLAAFPELSLTGYSIDDLLLSDVLLDEVLAAIETIRAASAGLLPAIIVGAPLRDGSRLHNCAVVIQGGAVRGVAPKSYLPTYREFYEKRHFASGDGAPGAQRILLPAVRAGAEAAAGRPTIEFRSAYDQGFARVAAVTLPVVLADPAANAAATIEQTRVLSDDGACLAVFPELGLTGYSIDDLLLSDVLLAEVLAAIETIRAASADLLPAIVVGAPLRCGSRLCNCAVVIQGGVVLGVAPKSYLPDYREFYEKRHFAAGVDGEGRGGAAGRRWIALPGVRDGRYARL